MAQTLTTIESWIETRSPNYVCVTGVHGVMESQRSDEIRGIHNSAGLVTPDGMPLVWLLRAAGHRSTERVYGPDLMLALAERASRHGYSHFLYGASESALTRIQSNLSKRYPNFRLAGAYSPPFRPLTTDEDAKIVKLINKSGADIVWVGLSTPKQERWMAEHRAQLRAPVLLGVGAAFDFHAGLVRQAPSFLQRNGLEWAFRLAMEPRRLWRRYLTNNPLFIFLVVRQILGLKEYRIEN